MNQDGEITFEGFQLFIDGLANSSDPSEAPPRTRFAQELSIHLCSNARKSDSILTLRHCRFRPFLASLSVARIVLWRGCGAGAAQAKTTAARARAAPLQSQQKRARARRGQSKALALAELRYFLNWHACIAGTWLACAHTCSTLCGTGKPDQNGPNATAIRCGCDSAHPRAEGMRYKLQRSGWLCPLRACNEN